MPVAAVDLGALGLDRGAHLLIKRALRGLPAGAVVRVTGEDPGLSLMLGAWCRGQGHTLAVEGNTLILTRGGAADGRWRGAVRAGDSSPTGVVDHPPQTWGLAARGATVEAGAPAFRFRLSDKDEVWTDDAARLYAAAAAAQWDPAVAIPWDAAFALPDEVEDAVVQVMTYLIENETAALLVPARFLGQVHPHFREIMQLLAVQVADEARHIEVFTRRASLKRDRLGLSTASGQASLGTLLDEPDFALATLLLGVLGEGSFLSLLRFLHQFAPDPVTAEVARLSAQDEARHVAFGLSHLCWTVERDPGLRPRLAAAIRGRHETLRDTAGLNEEVFDALILLAAGSWETDALARGWDRVLALKAEMDLGRQVRLRRLGFSEEEAEALSKLHTRNFM